MTKQTTFYLILCLFLFTSVNIFSQAPVITKQPSNQGVIEAQTATFFVEVTDDTLTYQWYKDGTAVTGATDSIYTTPATVPADNNAQFSVKVSNSHGSDSSSAAKLYVTASAERVTDGELVLYNFKEGGGNKINDISGVASPLDLNIHNTSSVDWSNNGLYVKDGAVINSTSSATNKLIDSVVSSNEITIEMWIRPLVIQNSRIINLTTSDINVDFGVEALPDKNGYNFIVKTTTTNDIGAPGIEDTIGLSKDLIHLTFTRSSDGISRIYRNGIETASSTIGGNLSNWVYNARLSLGSLLSGSIPWKGIFYLTAIYDRALDSAEIVHNFSLGVKGSEPPFIFEEPQTEKSLDGYSASFSVNVASNLPLSYQWQKDGIDIPGATDSSYTIPQVSLNDSGSVFRVIVANSSGSDTSMNAILIVKGINPNCPDGITHYYHLNESSSPYKDTVGFSNGTSSLSPASTTGIVGQALNFSNQEQINIPDDNTFDWTSNESFSIEFWMKTNSSSGTNVIIGRYASTSGLSWWVGLNSTGNVIFSLRNSGNEQAVVGGNSGPAVNDNNWHLIAATRDANANKLYLYVDGNKIDSISKTYTHGFDASTPITLGYLNITPYYYYKGSLDEVAIYLVALTQSIIQNHYTKGLKGVGYCGIIPTISSPKNLKAIAKFKQVVLTWQDSSANEDGFIIERSEIGPVTSAFEVIDTVTANDTSYTDLNVSDTTSYKYRVKAFNSLAESGYSNEVTIKTLLSTIPAPTELKAIKDSPDTTNVKLTWKDNSSNELGFILQRKMGDSAGVDTFAVIDTLGAGINSYIDSTISDTTKYTYRIYAYNADTVSAFSNLATITTPLPVELTSFTANTVNGKIMISWITATEINNAGFSIERSTDGKKFSEIGFIKGKGTSTEKSSYIYIDKSALSGKYYFRLKQIDFDGTYQYSKSVEIDMGLPTNYSLEQNYPNPFNPSTTIRFALPMNARVNIKLYNTLGQEVANILNSDLNAGVHETAFNASNLSSGVYFYRLEAHGVDGSNYISTKRMLLMK